MIVPLPPHIHLAGGGVNYNLLLFLQCLTVCSVDLFVLISGYYSSLSQRRTVGKPLDLLVQSVFFVIIAYIAKILTSDAEFSINHFVELFIPSNYFVILFITLYLVSPYINVALEKLNNRSPENIKRFMIVMLLLFSIFPMFTELIEHIVGRQITGFNSIGRLGSQSGYNIVNFVLLYCAGAAIRYLKLDIKISKRIALFASIGCVVAIYLMYQLCINPSMGHIAWHYDNLFVILLSVFLFIIFKQFQLKNRIINTLAKAAFVCFLIHGKILPYLRIGEFVDKSAYILLLHIVISLICIYVFSWLVWRVYSWATGRVVNYLDKVEIPLIFKDQTD